LQRCQLDLRKPASKGKRGKAKGTGGEGYGEKKVGEGGGEEGKGSPWCAQPLTPSAAYGSMVLLPSSSGMCV